MNYKIIKIFNRESEKWNDFAAWSGTEHCIDFYSLDSIMRPDLFSPQTNEDWDNCINEDFKLSLIKNLAYAQKISINYHNCEIVGVIINPKCTKEIVPANHELMGYDVIDGYCSISLLTNWGGKEAGVKHLKFNQHALVDDIEYAYQIKDMLRKDFPNDGHADECEVWAVYKIQF